MNNSGNLGNDVRNWLHYDDLTTTFFKQSARARQVRDEYEGKLQSLRSFKDLVERVDVGSECGISFEDYQGMEPDDRVEAYAARDAVGDDD